MRCAHWLAMAAVFVPGLLQGAEPAQVDRSWDFQSDAAGQPAAGFRTAVGKWTVAADGPNRVLEQSAISPDSVFNVILQPDVAYGDVDVSVRLKANEGSVDQGGGIIWRAKNARTYYVADITGQALLHVLYEQLMKYHEQIDRYEERFVTALVQDEPGECCGAIARNIRDGAMELFAAKATIQASGGAGQCFKPTTNALICTGDGIAQSYRIGAPLMDMEMIQYHPTTLAGNGILITEGARGEGAHLYNANGERFMEKYAPNKLELASRDVVSRSEQTEINEGRGFPDGTVALDITKVPRKRTLEALREIVNIGRDFAGVDITREPIHIKPGCHYIMGGVKTDVDGATSIPGLYAAGNVSSAVMGHTYAGPGATIGPALTFGYLAALDIAEET